MGKQRRKKGNYAERKNKDGTVSRFSIPTISGKPKWVKIPNLAEYEGKRGARRHLEWCRTEYGGEWTTDTLKQGANKFLAHIASGKASTIKAHQTRETRTTDTVDSHDVKSFDGPRRLAFPKLLRSTDIERNEETDHEDGSVIGSTLPVYTSSDPSEERMTRSVRPRLMKSYTTSNPSAQYQTIIRTHFVSPIIESLDVLAKTAQTPDCLEAVQLVLKKIREMRYYAPEDPVMDFLLAIYDAFVAGDRWADYNGTQYSSLRSLLAGLFNRKKVTNDAVDKALLKLDELGFDIVPYDLGFEEA